MLCMEGAWDGAVFSQREGTQGSARSMTRGKLPYDISLLLSVYEAAQATHPCPKAEP